MPTLHLLCGKIASGKSTLANTLAAEHAAIVLSEDHWLAQLYPGEILSIADYLRSAQRIRGVLGPLVIRLLHMPGQVAHDFHRLGHHFGAALGAVVGLQRSAVSDAGRVRNGLLSMDLVSDHRGEFHHFVQGVVGVPHRVVGGLQPDITAVAVDALKTCRDKLTRIQSLPKGLVLGTVLFLRGAEHPVMFTLDLRQGVTHACEKTLIGGQHFTLEVELDHRSGTHQRAHQVFMIAGGLNGARQVAGENRDAQHPACGVQDRLHDRTQPRLLTVAAQQAHGAAVMLLAVHGGFETQGVLVVFQVGRHQFINMQAQQRATAVVHLLDEIGVGRLDASIRAQGQHQHFAVKALPDLLKTGYFFAKSRQLLLQACVEHEVPGAMKECVQQNRL